MSVDEEYGGGTRDYRFRCVAAEELAPAGVGSFSAGIAVQDDIVIPYIAELGDHEPEEAVAHRPHLGRANRRDRDDRAYRGQRHSDLASSIEKASDVAGVHYLAVDVTDVEQVRQAVATAANTGAPCAPLSTAPASALPAASSARTARWATLPTSDASFRSI